MTDNSSDSEAERRRKVAEEKAYGYLIEAIERARNKPVAFSILLRLLLLHDAVEKHEQTVKELWSTMFRTFPTPSNKTILDKTNFLLRTYNDVIDDIYLHLQKRDSYIQQISKIVELEQFQLDDVLDKLYFISISIGQTATYMLRWIELEEE